MSGLQTAFDSVLLSFQLHAKFLQSKSTFCILHEAAKQRMAFAFFANDTIKVHFCCLTVFHFSFASNSIRCYFFFIVVVVVFTRLTLFPTFVVVAVVIRIFCFIPFVGYIHL